jgi:hypothetical protein
MLFPKSKTAERRYMPLAHNEKPCYRIKIILRILWDETNHRGALRALRKKTQT